MNPCPCPLRRTRAALAAGALLALAAAAAGCRADLPRLEDDPAIGALRAAAAPRSERAKLALAPVELDSEPRGDLARDPSRWPMRMDRVKLRAAVARAIGAATAFAAPRETSGIARKGGAVDPAAFADAQAHGEDVLVVPVVRRLDAVYRGYNWRWYFNIPLWIQFWVPSFWVPDETFAVEGELALRFFSVASERLLDERVEKLEAERPLDDFERGWSFTGIIRMPASMAEEDWGQASDALAPLATFTVERAAALAVGRDLRALLRSGGAAERDRSVYALCVGLSRYRGAIAGPAAAEGDAREVASLLERRLGVPAKNVTTLTDARATLEAVEAAIERGLGRARPDDAVVLTWSGVAAAGPGGERYLLPYDADPAALAGGSA
ncbi:MAG TPA: hypothetical protein VHF22_08330, partial [Planctomycetota bacterium]|nr:hypothetical protein [Planctomycetota bacterium]